MLGFATPVISNRIRHRLWGGLRFGQTANKVAGNLGTFGWGDFTGIGRGCLGLHGSRHRFWIAQVLGSGFQEAASLWEIAGFGVGRHGFELAIVDPAVAAIGFRKRGGAEANCAWAKASNVG